MSTPSSTASSFVGRVLADRYQIESVIGTGGMGAVYRARDQQRDVIVAIKVIHQLGPGTEEHHRRFFDEALIIGELFHPNIVQVIGFDREKDGTPFLIMELLRGKDLYDTLQEKGQLPLSKVLEIVRQVGSALHAAHNLGVAHRDIKPSNIFLSRQASSDGTETEVVKVVDFGLSKNIDDPAMRSTARGIILGTVEYVSPEGTTGESEHVDFHSDQWALAVVTYRMLTGKLPFEGKSPLQILAAIQKQPAPSIKSLVPDLPDYVATAIERAMAKEKKRRFDTVQDFVRALQGLPPLSQSLSTAADARGGARFNRRGSSSGIGIAGLADRSSSGDRSGNLAVPSSDASASQSAALPASAKSGDGAGAAGANPPPAAKEARPSSNQGRNIAIVALAMLMVLVLAFAMGFLLRRHNAIQNPPVTLLLPR